MRLLFKWAIPWSDSPCHTQPHPISPCCTQAESTRPAGAEGPLALRSTECCALLLPWAEGHAGTRLHLKKCLHHDISFKKQILCFSAWNHSLFSPAICTIHFGACQRATVALLIVFYLPAAKGTLTVLLCVCFIVQNSAQRYLVFELFCFKRKTIL